MISMIEEKISIFKNPEEKRKILGMLKAVGISLFSMGNYALKEKMGLDMKNFLKYYELELKRERKHMKKNIPMMSILTFRRQSKI